MITASLPKNVEGAVEWLLSQLPLKNRASLASMGEQDLPSLNHSFGEYIRRRFGLESGNAELLASCAFIAKMKDLSPALGVVWELWGRSGNYNFW